MSFVADNFGIKINNISALFTPGLIKLLNHQVDYVEYTSPVLNPTRMRQYLKFGQNKIRPHSAYISLLENYAPPSRMLELIKKEVISSGVTYLGEHIGTLSNYSNSAGTGYIIPPALNMASVNAIVKNVRTLQSFLKVPLALENPIFYTYPPDSDMTWSEFIQELHVRLPRDTGWLIDFAHLFASSLNVKESIETMLRSYQKSKRKIFEFHMAGVYLDKQGVAHDDHRNINDNQLKCYINLTKKFNLNSEFYTLEKAITKGMRVQTVIDDFIAFKSALIRLCKDGDFTSDMNCMNANKISSKKIDLIEAESQGRNVIFHRTLSKQIDALPKKSFIKLMYAAGYETTELFAKALIKDKKALKFSIPLFDNEHQDHIDLLGPALAHIIQSLPGGPACDAEIRKLLFAIACRQLVTTRLIGRLNVSIRLGCKTRFMRNEPGVYEIIYKKQCLYLKQVSKDELLKNDFIEITEGDSQWRLIKLKKRLRIQRKSLAKRVLSKYSKVSTVIRNTKNIKIKKQVCA